MPRRSRAPVALLALTLLTAAAGFETAFHAHSAWEQDLRPHDLAMVDCGAGCDAAPHWDRAHADHHPACPACAAAATPFDRQAAPASTLLGVPRLALRPAPASTAPRRAPISAPTGRAPPTRLLAVV